MQWTKPAQSDGASPLISGCSADYCGWLLAGLVKWPLMTPEELHTFGIEAILPYLQKEGVTVEHANLDPTQNPQIVGKRWNALAFIAVRTACYPRKGELTSEEFDRILAWADQHRATAFFASVGVACIAHPDKSEITDESEMGLPIRHGGFNIAYEGLVIMVTADRVKLWPQGR